MLKNRKFINFLSYYYYKLMPGFILNSKKFHEALYKILIGPWFNVDFKREYKKYTERSWIKLYDSLFVNRIRDEDLTENQKKYILDNILGPNVLEIGCGTGSMIEKIAQNKNVKKIVGNDISPKAIEFLKEKFKNLLHVTFIGKDFLKLKLKREFDSVCCFHVIEHIVDIKKMASLMMSASRKRIIVIVPKEEYHPYPPNYHIHFFNEKNSICNLFPKRKNILKIIEGDYVLISDN